MRKFYDKINSLKSSEDYDEYNIKDALMSYMISRNLSIPDEVIYYSFVEHYSSEWFLEEFIDIKLDQCEFQELVMTTNDVLNIEYANFVDDGIKTECDWYDEIILKYYRENNFPTGTFNHPILVIFKNGKYIALDGNNRLRFFRSLVKFRKEIILPSHNVFFLMGVE